MAILKVENLSGFFKDLNDYDSANEIFGFCSTLENLDSEDYYNERLHMDKFFKRFTVSIENGKEYRTFRYKLAEEYRRIDSEIDGLKSDYRFCRLGTIDKEDEKTLELLGNRIERATKNLEILSDIIMNLDADLWGSNMTHKGARLNKSLKKCGVSQSFLDWSSTQEKSKQIVQITFNPTVQAVAGMSNFARSGSWNGHNGTSCQDTRHSETYTRSLVGAIADDTLYSIQMNYLEDNECLYDSIEMIREDKNCSFEDAYDIALEDYDITDDILYNDNFQDKLKARVLGKVWNLQEQKDYYNEYERVDEELEGLMKQFFELGLDLDFMKTIRGYGSDKTKSELKDALTQISKVENLIPTGIK